MGAVDKIHPNYKVGGRRLYRLQAKESIGLIWIEDEREIHCTRFRFCCAEKQLPRFRLRQSGNHWDAQPIARQSLSQASLNLHFDTARRCCAAWREQPDIGVEAGCGRPCFGNILDQLRSDLAAQYLGDGNLSISLR